MNQEFQIASLSGEWFCDHRAARFFLKAIIAYIAFDLISLNYRLIPTIYVILQLNCRFT